MEGTSSFGIPKRCPRRLSWQFSRFAWRRGRYSISKGLNNTLLYPNGISLNAVLEPADNHVRQYHLTYKAYDRRTLLMQNVWETVIAFIVPFSVFPATLYHDLASYFEANGMKQIQSNFRNESIHIIVGEALYLERVYKWRKRCHMTKQWT